MNEVLRHRGPDEEGFHLEDLVGLAHARLQVIDLHSGRQPIANEDESVWVICNGEVFNYLELRRELETRGHRLRTHTDTEVIVHLYEEMGLDFVDRLNGQFAIVLWDARRQRLVMARDRVGIVPLFYTEVDGRLLFASEIKSLLRGGAEAALDPNAYSEVLHWWAPVSPRTVFRNIQEVPPGHLVVCAGGSRTLRRYWDWTFPDQGEFLAGDSRALAEELYSILLDATELRLLADVKVGAYLSGGLDSSALLALIRDRRSDTLDTFALGFEDRSIDERQYQRLVAERFATRHHEFVCTEKMIADEFLRTVWHAETPLVRLAPIPMGILSRQVRDARCKVALTGEGSDEALGGYDIFRELKIRTFCEADPGSSRRPKLFSKLYPFLDPRKGDGSLLGSIMMRRIDPRWSRIASHSSRWASLRNTTRLLSDDFRISDPSAALEAFDRTLPAEFDRWHPLNRAQFVEAKTLTSGYLLSAQGDRMSMRHSVEARFPFFDHRVIEFANKLDPRLKIRGLNEKFLLKKAMATRLPAPVLRRRKQAYRSPGTKLFLKDNLGWVEHLLSPNLLRSYGYFDAKRVAKLVAKLRGTNQTPSYSDETALTMVLSTQAWHELFVSEQSWT